MHLGTVIVKSQRGWSTTFTLLLLKDVAKGRYFLASKGNEMCKVFNLA